MTPVLNTSLEILLNPIPQLDQKPSFNLKKFVVQRLVTCTLDQISRTGNPFDLVNHYYWPQQQLSFMWRESPINSYPFLHRKDERIKSTLHASSKSVAAPCNGMQSAQEMGVA